MAIVSYKNRARNIVFIFGNDAKPTLEQVYKHAFEPQREIKMYHVKTHQEMLEIFNLTSTAYEYFVTKSVPPETLIFLSATQL